MSFELFIRCTCLGWGQPRAMWRSSMSRTFEAFSLRFEHVWVLLSWEGRVSIKMVDSVSGCRGWIKNSNQSPDLVLLTFPRMELTISVHNHALRAVVSGCTPWAGITSCRIYDLPCLPQAMRRLRWEEECDERVFFWVTSINEFHCSVSAVGATRFGLVMLSVFEFK